MKKTEVSKNWKPRGKVVAEERMITRPVTWADSSNNVTATSTSPPNYNKRTISVESLFKITKTPNLSNMSLLLAPVLQNVTNLRQQLSLCTLGVKGVHVKCN